MYNYLQHHGLEHTRLPCPLPTNSRSLLKLISIELVMPSKHSILCWPFSSCLQFFPASESFPISCFFKSCGQSSLALSFLYDPALTSIPGYWKTIALTRQTFVGKVMSLLFNMLSRFVIAFLPRSNRLLTSWLQSSSAMILEPKKIKSVTVSIVLPFICHEVMGVDAIILVFLNVKF